MDTRVNGYLRRVFVVIGVAFVVVAGWTGYRLWRAWSDVDRVSFNPGSARVALEGTGSGQVEVDYEPIPAETPLEQAGPIIEGELAQEADAYATALSRSSDETVDAYLIIGSDQRDALGQSRRADVILMFILPADGANPILLSIPRDLYLPNPCTGEMSRINANLNGCGDFANGPEQLAVAVEDFTGIQVDHFAVFDFDGFRAIVDRVGGIEVCVENPVRDLNVQPTPLRLPAGCSTIGGDMALSWVRSRRTQEQIDGVWRTMDSVSDLARNQRQQDLIVQALSRVKRFTDISELTALVEDLSNTFTIDDNLSLGQAIGTAWSLRSLDLSTIVRPVLEVANYIDPYGRYVLVPTKSFEEVVVAADPSAASLFAPAEG
ncbi:MAG TPA: LCP family protein [Acidimicrobiia bacterium]|nr:LCP family protein [Acidimicrobiia bacterium]